MMMSNLSKKQIRSDRASIYANFIPILRKEAERSGYAMAVHGSMINDLDLVCIPWVEKVVTTRTLIRRLMRLYNCLDIDKSRITKKPHGRIAVSISISGQVAFDISIITPAVQGERKSREPNI
jgi:hypothetical protein